jgi:hypothetical protein
MISFQEAKEAARDMAQLTDVPVYLFQETEAAVLVSRQDDRFSKVWIPSFMCEIRPGKNLNSTTTGMGARTLTAARKVLEWKGLLA